MRRIVKLPSKDEGLHADVSQIEPDHRFASQHRGKCHGHMSAAY
jgi:hypothetical protein